MQNLLAALGALVPPVGVGLIFWVVLRSIIRADRSERAAIARLDAEAAGLRSAPGSDSGDAAQVSPLSAPDDSPSS